MMHNWPKRGWPMRGCRASVRPPGEREQLAEAYAVQVALGSRGTGDPGKRGAIPRRLAAIVVNHGQYTSRSLTPGCGLRVLVVPAWSRLPRVSGCLRPRIFIPNWWVGCPRGLMRCWIRGS